MANLPLRGIRPRYRRTRSYWLDSFRITDNCIILKNISFNNLKHVNEVQLQAVYLIALPVTAHIRMQYRCVWPRRLRQRYFLFLPLRSGQRSCYSRGIFLVFRLYLQVIFSLSLCDQTGRFSGLFVSANSIMHQPKLSVMHRNHVIILRPYYPAQHTNKQANSKADSNRDEAYLKN
jgi:hypothetical protein